MNKELKNSHYDSPLGYHEHDESNSNVVGWILIVAETSIKPDEEILLSYNRERNNESGDSSGNAQSYVNDYKKGIAPKTPVLYYQNDDDMKLLRGFLIYYSI